MLPICSRAGANIWIMLLLIGLLGCTGNPIIRPSESVQKTEKLDPFSPCSEQMEMVDQSLHKEEVLNLYEMVLLNESEFLFVDCGEALYLNDYYQELFSEDIEAGASFEKEYAIVDLNDDEIPEVVINFIGPDIRLVLYGACDSVYGHQFGNKALGTIKADGSFRWGYATYYGWGRLEFTGRTYDVVKLAFYEFIPPLDTGKYFIGNCEVMEEQFLDFENSQNQIEEIKWYMLTEKNVRSTFA